MNKVLLSLLFVGGLLPATFAAAQTSISADDMLRSNERVMDALMQRIQRINDVSERQTLIVEHMKMMEIYLTNIEKRLQSETDLRHKAHLEETYTNGLQRSLVLIDSGIAGGDFVVMGNTVDEHLFYLEQRMSILQSLMRQQLGANSVLNNQRNDEHKQVNNRFIGGKDERSRSQSRCIRGEFSRTAFKVGWYYRR
ncbi:hypothetical protein [Alteromonas oceanisediminis]|uniref:hypothetical protein n=1 Tax=Alteromonas oceanisediminis TaxID=2836180 RepID=UPI002023ADCF|nr:hypothetical protein [Alteromonas oceanisediminis]